MIVSVDHDPVNMPTLENTKMTTHTRINGVVVVFLFDFLPQHRSWAWLKLMQGNAALFKALPGLLFAKVMGSGEGGGFGLRPSGTHQGLILIFDGLTTARECLLSPEINQYKERTREFWQCVLSVDSCRGAWNQKSWESTDVSIKELKQEKNSYIASLTRGSIRASKALSFWRYAPEAQKDLALSQGCELAVGLGEAPILRQCTFSIWKDTASLMNYAHQGAHLKAISAAQKHEFFVESMFVRMSVHHMFGRWMGKSYDLNLKLIDSLKSNQ